ncbi:hypothetical protein TNCV_4693371 [Trichonephila clavipes]|uniref:Uncharacterized protein n=1 Tax=Trichonephila clavipes TaxID=2585209 RepID=A0A8X6WAM9_TRICX|nr:hypothetical protein TNCV_4693371 [Trichonephila clavipes]
MWCEKKTASVFATLRAIFQVENQSSSLAMCLCKKVAPHAILYQTLSGYLGKQLRLISGREILSLYTPPPAEAGVMWRVRLGSRVVGELVCHYR